MDTSDGRKEKIKRGVSKLFLISVARRKDRLRTQAPIIVAEWCESLRNLILLHNRSRLMRGVTSQIRDISEEQQTGSEAEEKVLDLGTPLSLDGKYSVACGEML